MKIEKNIVILILLVILSTLLIWLPFSLGLGKGMLSVFANYDGPNYITVTKTWYDKEAIRRNFSLPIPLEYYPAHFPGYPALIKIFDLFLPGTWAMLISTLLATTLATITFYLFLKKYRLSNSPLWLTVVFLFLPARFLIVRGIGSPESLFIFSILASFYFFKQRNWWLAGIFGAIAQVTKTPGILLFLAYGVLLTAEARRLRKIPWKAYPLFLIPLAALGVFTFYWARTGDFLAYFHSGDNFHLVFPPFQSFNTERSWLGDFWLEDMVWQYLIGALAVLQLIKLKHFDLATFAGIFFAATLFVAHRDLSRYALPLAPFALIAFSSFLEKKEFKIAFLVVLAGVYLYAINFILHNTAPIADWTPYL